MESRSGWRRWHRARTAVRTALVGILLAATLPAAAHAQLPGPTTRTIDFETFPNGDPIDTSTREPTITDEFRDSHGVVFPGALGGLPGVKAGRCDQLDFNRSCGGAFTEGGAHSGRNVTRPHEREFNRAPLIARLTTPQSRVAVWVAGELEVTDQLRVVLAAYDADGGLIGFDEERGNGQLSWTRLEVAMPSLPLLPPLEPAISRVEVTSQQLVDGEPSIDIRNFVAIDDLTVEGPPPPPSVPDTEAPRVFLNVDARPESQLVRFSVDVQDNRDLRRVRAELLDSNGDRIRESTLCGPDPSRPCPVAGSEGQRVTFSTNGSFSMRGLPEGGYSLRVIAEDAAGNTRTGHQDFEWGLPAPVIPYAVEVNQGAGSNLLGNFSPVDRCGDGDYCSQLLRLIPNRDTLVRLYLFADGKDRPDYSPQLRIELTKRDGSVDVRTIEPNATSSFNQGALTRSVTVPEHPGTAEEAARIARGEMQPDLDRTLNYVIPASFLHHRRVKELRLLPATDNRGGFPWVIERNPPFFARPAALGINFIRLTGDAGENPPSFVEAEANILPYLQAAYPVSEVPALSRRTLRVEGNGLLGAADISVVCQWASEVWSVFGGDDAPVKRFNFAGPQVSASLGFIPRGGVPTGDGSVTSGCAWPVGTAFNPLLGDPGDEDDRIGMPSVATIEGDVAAQEIAHNLGLLHAGTNHGEDQNSQIAEPNWHWMRPGNGPHGTIAPRDFGVIPQRTSAAGEHDFGEWDVTLIDPCFTTNPAERFPTCTVTGKMDATGNHLGIHDFMSYGDTSPNQGGTDPDSATPENLGPLVTSDANWTSFTTWSRIHGAIARGSKYRGPCVGDEFACDAFVRGLDYALGEVFFSLGSTDSLLVQGTLHPDGSVELAPLLRKFVPPTMVAAPEDDGDDPDVRYTIELLDAHGAVLLSQPIPASPFSGGEGHGGAAIVRAIPYVEGAARLVLRRGDEVIAEREASANPPRVRLLSPSGGEGFGSGDHLIRWEASDPDGDPLWSLLQYSPDGGETWQGIELTGPDEPREVKLRVDELVPGDQGIIRVVVSDGLNTAAATPACPIAVGSDDAEECKADLSVTKADSADPIFVEDELTYELTVANAGPARADDVELVDALPGGVELVSAPQGCELDGPSGELTCELGSLEADDERTVGIVVEVTAAGELRNAASVSSSITDPNGANDSAAERTTVLELTPIDIKPGSDANPIAIADERGVTPVAVLSSADLDAPAAIDRESLRFGRTGEEDSLAHRGSGAPQCGTDDVDADGREDLVCQFHTEDTGFREGDQRGILTGALSDGTPIKGKDPVRVVP